MLFVGKIALSFIVVCILGTVAFLNAIGDRNAMVNLVLLCLVGLAAYLIGFVPFLIGLGFVFLTGLFQQ